MALENGNKTGGAGRTANSGGEVLSGARGKDTTTLRRNGPATEDLNGTAGKFGRIEPTDPRHPAFRAPQGK